MSREQSPASAGPSHMSFDADNSDGFERPLSSRPRNIYIGATRAHLQPSADDVGTTGKTRGVRLTASDHFVHNADNEFEVIPPGDRPSNIYSPKGEKLGPWWTVRIYANYIDASNNKGLAIHADGRVELFQSGVFGGGPPRELSPQDFRALVFASVEATR